MCVCVKYLYAQIKNSFYRKTQANLICFTKSFRIHFMDIPLLLTLNYINISQFHTARHILFRVMLLLLLAQKHTDNLANTVL